jgi:hypothetical protein
MSARIAALAEALEREGIPLCQWKGAAALERALLGERDLDGLVPAAAWPRALALIEGAGWKRARPLHGEDEPGTAHFFGWDPDAPRLLHLHLHDRVLSGEDWINSHALPFAADLLASERRAHGVRVPEPAAEAALTVLKHALRWGSWPDRITARLRPKDERAELAALLVEPVVAEAAALVTARVPALDEGTFRAGARLLLGAPAESSRRRVARRVRVALRPWARFGPGRRAAAYLGVGWLRAQRLLDRDRPARAPWRGPVRFGLRGEGADAAAADLAGWLGQVFRTSRRTGPGGEAWVSVGDEDDVAAERTHRLEPSGQGAGTVRGAAWAAL